MESNLFAEWSKLGAIPWMIATLKDFYANMVIIVLWMFYKERTWLSRIVWTVLFVCLGSIATSAYVLVQLFRISAKDPLEKILLRN
jgi:predicted permease